MGTLDRADYLKHRFSGSQRVVHWRELRLVRELLRVANPQGRVLRVLDAPCGHGRFTELLRTAGEPVCGDADPRHLQALGAAERALGNPVPPRVELRLGDPLPFDDRTFDVVLSFRFLHHVRESELRERVLSELLRVSNAHVIASYYQSRSLHSLQKALGPRRSGKRPLALISRARMRTLCAQIGGRVVLDRAAFPGVHAQRVALIERV